MEPKDWAWIITTIVLTIVVNAINFIALYYWVDGSDKQVKMWKWIKICAYLLFYLVYIPVLLVANI